MGEENVMTLIPGQIPNIKDGTIQVTVREDPVRLTFWFLGSLAQSVSVNGTPYKCSQSEPRTMTLGGYIGGTTYKIESKYYAGKICSDEVEGNTLYAAVAHKAKGTDNPRMLLVIYGTIENGIVIQMENVFEALGGESSVSGV